MEPRQPAYNGEFGSQPVVERGESSFERAGLHEQLQNVSEKRPEATMTERESTPPMIVPALPAPVVAVPDDDNSQHMTATDDSAGLAAADQDLIEKEWVDKAKKIINDTRDDPYKREQEISKLQIEYIRKRYGREIGQAGSE